MLDDWPPTDGAGAAAQAAVMPDVEWLPMGGREAPSRRRATLRLSLSVGCPARKATPAPADREPGGGFFIPGPLRTSCRAQERRAGYSPGCPRAREHPATSKSRASTCAILTAAIGDLRSASRRFPLWTIISRSLRENQFDFRRTLDLAARSQSYQDVDTRKWQVSRNCVIIPGCL
jgi:hypothetical protein